MPIPSINTDQPAAVCCESWYAVVEGLTLLVGNAVTDCLGSTCGPFRVYVSHAEPIGGGDYVAGWLADLSPIVPATGVSTVYGAMPYRMTIGMAVSLSGFPGIEYTDGGKIAAVPSPAEYLHATYFTYGVAERMWRTVANEAVKGRSGTFGACAHVQLGSLNPQLPDGYNARWGMSIQADI